MTPKINVGIVGLGYWGPSIVRNFVRADKSKVTWVCDTNKKALNKIKNIYPFVKVTTDYQDLLLDKDLNAIAITTPPKTHYKIASDSLNAKKHTIVAKPIAQNLKEALKLLSLAKKNNVNFACDLTYIYTGAIKKIKEVIKNKEIGQPLYYDSVRTNFGRFQSETNVVSDLVPHDLSILLECFKTTPKSVIAIGSHHIKNSKNLELAHIILNFENNFTAHIHVSWLTPVKVRIIQIGGDHKMIYFDDISPDEKVKIYDCGVRLPVNEITPFKPFYRSGDVVTPKLDNEEALFTEVNEFNNETISGKFSYKTAKMGVEIARIIDACQKSLKIGRAIKL